MNFSKRIIIRSPRIVSRGNRARLTAELDFDGDVKDLWFEVPKEYGRYLCAERSDAFLIAVLNYAQRKGFDVECEMPVCDELLFQLREYLIPSLAKHGHQMYHTRIFAKESRIDIRGTAVGTGVSCGVDSMHVMRNFLCHDNPRFRLTHLVLNNVGAFNVKKRQYDWQVEHARKLAKDVGIALIETDSNIVNVLQQNHILTHTYSAGFAIYALQKLWRVFYYGSSGHDFGDFSIKDNDENDSAYYELLSLQMFSTSMLRVYSEGGAKTRYEKTKDIINFPLAWKYLHVCVSDEGENCGACSKCHRTLVMLDVLGVIERFRNVFDVERYIKNRHKELRSAASVRFRRLSGDKMLAPIYGEVKKEMSFFDWPLVLIMAAWGDFRHFCYTSPFIYSMYNKLRKLQIMSFIAPPPPRYDHCVTILVALRKWDGAVFSLNIKVAWNDEIDQVAR